MGILSSYQSGSEWYRREEVRLSHMKLTWTIGNIHSGVRLTLSRKRKPTSGEDIWVPDYEWDLPVNVPAGEARRLMQRFNREAKEQYREDLHEMARRENQRRDWQKDVKQAREDFEEWVHSLPLSADQYKEDGSRWIYPGGTDSRKRAREESVTEWAKRKAQQKWPEEARNVKAEIRDEYDLADSTRLA